MNLQMKLQFAIPGPFFTYFCYFNTVDSKQVNKCSL